MQRIVAVAMVVAVIAVAGTGSARSGRDLTDEELRLEMAHNRALAAYVARNGMPDVAETRSLSDQPPWDDREVALYYLGGRKEIAFARAWILGRPTIHIERYERALTDAQVAALSQRVHHGGNGPAERAEDAARRADAAAARVETAAASAEQAATHAEAVAGKAESAFHHSLRK